MGNNRTSGKGNPSASTSLQKNHDFAMASTANAAADYNVGFHDGNIAGGHPIPMSFPNMSLPVAPSWQNSHSTYRPCTQEITKTGGNLTADFMLLRSLQNPKIDPNFKHIRTTAPRIINHSEVPYPEWSHFPQDMNQDGLLIADNAVKGGAGFSSHQNPQKNRNFMLSRNAAGGYQMARLVGETKSTSIDRPQINGNCAMVIHGQEAQDDGQKQIGDNVRVNADRHGFHEKIDGNFLSLGIGGNAEFGSKAKFSSLEIARKLEGGVPPDLTFSHARQTTRSSLSQDQILAADFPGFQSNAGGFSNPVCSGGGWTLSNNDIAVTCAANSGPGSSPFHIVQTLQKGSEHHLSTRRDWNSNVCYDRKMGYAESDSYRVARSNQALLLGALGNNSARFQSSKEIDLSGLAPESDKPTWIPTQTSSGQFPNVYVKTAKNFSIESSMSSTLGHRGTSSGQNIAGPVFPSSRCSVTQAAESGQFPMTIGAQRTEQLSYDGIAAEAAGSHLFSQWRGVQVAESSTTQTARGLLFPKRLGVEASGIADTESTERHLFPMGLDQHIASKLAQRPAKASAQNLLGPSLSTGRPADVVPIRSSNLLVPPSITVDGLSRGTDVYGRPPLKRSAVQPPPAARWVQRRKLAHPIIYPSVPLPPQAISPTPVAASAAAHHHIKWQDFAGSDGPPQSTGEKCLLCKRDLSFTSEGRVYQPPVPPAVAILPCGHTFHDQCLQNITPEDQSKDPPCIPCAIGEN